MLKHLHPLPLLTSVVAVPAVLLLVFHLLLYGFQPESPADLQEIGKGLWHYLLYEPGLLLPDILSLDMHARSHMLDVKRILIELRHIWLVFSACLLLLLGLQVRHRCLLTKTLRWSAWAGLGVLVAGLLLAVLNFRWAFVMLHFLLFSQQNWVFPADSALIRLFPLSYFQQFFVYWLGLSVLGFLSLWLLARMLRRNTG